MAKLKYFKFVKSNTPSLFAFDLVSITLAANGKPQKFKFVLGESNDVKNVAWKPHTNINLNWNASLAAVPAAWI